MTVNFYIQWGSREINLIVSSGFIFVDDLVTGECLSVSWDGPPQTEYELGVFGDCTEEKFVLLRDAMYEDDRTEGNLDFYTSGLLI